MAPSQSGQTQGQRSSQVPRTRAPPQGSMGSGRQQDDFEQKSSRQRSSSGSQDEGYIPSEAITSNTSWPNRSSYPEQDQRRQSQVTFVKAPPLDPSDSISQMNAHSTAPGPNRNSGRRFSRQTRTSWNDYESQGTRASSQNGTAWSGTGPALTENALERFNEETEKAKSTVYDDQSPPSDQQEVPKSGFSKSRRNTTPADGGDAQTNGSARRSSRRSRYAASANDAETNGSQRTARRSSRQHSKARSVYAQSQAQRASRSQYQGSSRNTGGGGSVEDIAEAATGGAAAEGAGEAVYSSQSKQQSVAVSKNAVDANNSESGANQTSGASQLRSKAVSRSGSKRDSKFEAEEEVAETSNEVTTQSRNERTSQVSRSKLPMRPAQPSTSPTTPTSPTLPWGYERGTRIVTRRWPDGTETREREVRTMQPVGAA